MACFLCSQVFAETVTQKQASELAHTFFNEASGRMTPKPKLVWNGKRLTTDRLFSPFYVYNTQSGGFVMISAENKAFPILAYSLTDNFDPESLSESEKAFFSDYARDIEHIRYVADVPYQAIEAWQDYPGYVKKILNADYRVAIEGESIESAKQRVDNLIQSDLIESLSSDMYTQSQWQDLINEDLNSGRDVVLGILSDKSVAPAIIYGKKGDYYKINFERPNNRYLRINPSEIFSGWQIADILNPVIPPLPEEESPFSFYSEILESFEADRIAEEMAVNEILNPTEPKVKGIGGGHFEIFFPEDINYAAVYNISGSMVERQTYRSTDVAHINIAHQPNGFYFVVVRGVSGKPYGFKIYR